MMNKTYRIKKVSMDLYRSTILKEALTTAGFEVEIVRRGPATHSMLAPLVEEMFIKQTIVLAMILLCVGMLVMYTKKKK